jgi:hypothetical protein
MTSSARATSTSACSGSAPFCKQQRRRTSRTGRLSRSTCRAGECSCCSAKGRRREDGDAAQPHHSAPRRQRAASSRLRHLGHRARRLARALGAKRRRHRRRDKMAVRRHQPLFSRSRRPSRRARHARPLAHVLRTPSLVFHTGLLPVSLLAAGSGRAGRGR